MISILVVNNRDSFVYNLVEYLKIGSNCKIDIVLSDCIILDNMQQYDGILLSPGARLPSDYPQMIALIDKCKFTHSILGICLGHQAIASYFGAELRQLKAPKHGHTSQLFLKENMCLTYSIDNQTPIGRYHSWVVNPQNLPPEIIVSAVDECENIMMIRHCILPIYGLQFHPESIISKQGLQMIQNWIKDIGKKKVAR